MFISRECDYAVRIVRALADMEIKQAGNICEQEDIPNAYAYKILKKLETAEITRSSRGAQGGYKLIKKPQELTLYDVFTAVDDEFLIIECMRDGHTCPHNTQSKGCKVHCELLRIQYALRDHLREKTLEEILAG